MKTEIPNFGLIVFIVTVVLIGVAYGTLHPHTASAALICVVLIAFAIYLRVFKAKTILIAAGVTLAFLLSLNGIEIWQERQGQKRQEEIARQRAFAAEEQERKQKEAFQQLSPKEHLEKARTLLKVDSFKPMIDEGMRNLDAIPESAPEYADSKLLRQQYVVAKKKYMDEQARRSAAIAKQNAAASVKQQKREAVALEEVRKAYAKTLESHLLSKGLNADVVSYGPGHTTLKVVWVLATKVDAYQLSHDNSDLFDEMRLAGFKKFIVSDGYDNQWTWTLDK